MDSKKENLKANEVVAPTLFVGVGGTGCKIVKKVCDLCAPAEKENINFLCLDTNVNDLSGVANGKNKADIICAMATGPVTPQVPASILQLHGDVTIFADKEALSVLMEKAPELISGIN